MANAFKNVTIQGTLAADTDHAVGSVIPNATTTQTIIGMTVANVSSPAEVINVSVKMFLSSTETYIVKDAPIPTGGSLVVVGGDQKVVLFHNGTNGNQIKVRSNVANSINVIMSYLEST